MSSEFCLETPFSASELEFFDTDQQAGLSARQVGHASVGIAFEYFTNQEKRRRSNIAAQLERFRFYENTEREEALVYELKQTSNQLECIYFLIPWFALALPNKSARLEVLNVMLERSEIIREKYGALAAKRFLIHDARRTLIELDRLQIEKLCKEHFVTRFDS